jgi:predicted SPOUT superfamily RNA methylase MTH1
MKNNRKITRRINRSIARVFTIAEAEAIFGVDEVGVYENSQGILHRNMLRQRGAI